MDQPPKPSTKTPEERWEEWLVREIQQLRQDIQSGTDSFDTNMLTLSSGALGVSLAFIKDIVPLGQATWMGFLFASWVAFAGCIIATASSFRVSKAALKKQMQQVIKVYNERLPAQPNLKTPWLDFCTGVATYLFLGGLVFTMLFVVRNVKDFQYEQRKQIQQSHDGSSTGGLRKGTGTDANDANARLGGSPEACCCCTCSERPATGKYNQRDSHRGTPGNRVRQSDGQR